MAFDVHRLRVRPRPLLGQERRDAIAHQDELEDEARALRAYVDNHPWIDAATRRRYINRAERREADASAIQACLWPSDSDGNPLLTTCATPACNDPALIADAFKTMGRCPDCWDALATGVPRTRPHDELPQPVIGFVR